MNADQFEFVYSRLDRIDMIADLLDSGSDRLDRLDRRLRYESFGSYIFPQYMHDRVSYRHCKHDIYPPHISNCIYYMMAGRFEFVYSRLGRFDKIADPIDSDNDRLDMMNTR